MCNLITIKNVRCYIDDESNAWLNLEDVAFGLGITEVAKSGNTVVIWKRIRQYLKDLNVIDTSVDGTGKENLPEFVKENIFYRLCMKAKNETAQVFQSKVCDEILPELRKNGSYFINSNQFPKDYISALKEFVKLQEEKVEREKKLKEAEDKRDKMINYINFKFRFARTTYTTTEIAKTLGFSSAKQLGEILQEYGVLKRSFYTFTYTNGDTEEKSYLELTPKYLSKDYAVLDTKRNGAKVLRWKEAGIYFICDLLFNNQMLDYELKLIETKEEHYQKLLTQHTYKQEQISKYYKNKYGSGR